MSKRGFFVFEPLIVLVFISMLAIASFVVLKDKTGAINEPLGRHAAQLTKTAITSENEVFLPRELKARYAIENAVYVLASGGGRAGTSYCQREGMSAPGETPAIPSSAIADWPTTVTSFNALITSDLKAPVPYEFVLEAPLKVTGLALQPETIVIPDPIPSETALRFTKAPVQTNSAYLPRVSFEVSYNYPMKEMYDALREAVDFIDTTSDLDNCRAYPTGEAKTACVTQKMVALDAQTKGLLRWSVDVTNAASDQYIVTAHHEIKMPLCKNQPVTRIKFTLPTLQ